MLEPLFSPISIGNLSLENRVVMPAMVTRFASDEGYATDDTRRYYRERARGGTGLIIFESTYPCEKHPKRHTLVNDTYVDALASVVDDVHAEGGSIAVQMNPHRASADKLEPLAPSQLTTPEDDTVPEISEERIESLVTQFAAGAERAMRAGFDGIEVHGASGYLVNQFLSPRTNERTDEYGGSIEGRTRFARELLAGVRDIVGDDLPVWFRIPGNEFIEGGIDELEATNIAKRLQKAGSDAIHVTAGHNWNSRHVVLSGRDEPALYADIAATIRREVSVPVIAVGRINDPELANEILASGKADLTAMGRAHIADPHFVRKAENGEFDRIRRCIGGLEGCRDLITIGGLTCTVNPQVGREGETVDAVDEPRSIAVIGAGPAGLEAARWAAKRGHDVTIFDRADEVGGQLRWAKNAPGKEDYRQLLSFFETELDRHRVEIQLNTPVEMGNFSDLHADSVIVATGSEPDVPSIEGITSAIDSGDITTPEAILSSEPTDLHSVVIYGGTERGIDTADFLSQRNVASTIVTPGPLLPSRIIEAEGMTPRDHILQRVEQNADIEMLPHSKLLEIGGEYVEVRTKSGDRSIRFDRIVLAGDRNPRTGASTHSESVHVIGDAANPRDLLSSIREGAEIGREI